MHTGVILPTGSRWRIHLNAGPLTFDGEVEVVSCRQRGGGYVVGLRFT